MKRHQSKLVIIGVCVAGIILAIFFFLPSWSYIKPLCGLIGGKFSGGSWAIDNYCELQGANDAGKICTDSGQCKGSCIGVLAVVPPLQGSGNCSEWIRIPAPSCIAGEVRNGIIRSALDCIIGPG